MRLPATTLAVTHKNAPQVYVCSLQMQGMEDFRKKTEYRI